MFLPAWPRVHPSSNCHKLQLFIHYINCLEYSDDTPANASLFTVITGVSEG